jgi:hypothetical protein
MLAVELHAAMLATPFGPSDASFGRRTTPGPGAYVHFTGLRNREGILDGGCGIVRGPMQSGRTPVTVLLPETSLGAIWLLKPRNLVVRGRPDNASAAVQAEVAATERFVHESEPMDRSRGELFFPPL